MKAELCEGSQKTVNMQEVNVKSILSASNGMNLYRGCTHGCIYCDARSTCYQIHLDRPFEDIEIKVNAPALLEEALRKKRRKCMIGTGGMCDPYMPIEEQTNLTRQCLELIEYYGFGVAIQTKSDRILRDLDLLKRINEKTKCVVEMTLTTCDEELCKILEPNVATTKRRVEVLQIMREEGIPTVCWLTPILPFINDTEENIRGLLQYCVDVRTYGIMMFGIGVTLRDGDRQYFYQKLDEHFPGMKEKYISRYGSSYELNSDCNQELMSLVRKICSANQIEYHVDRVFDYLHEFIDRGEGEQLTLF